MKLLQNVIIILLTIFTTMVFAVDAKKVKQPLLPVCRSQFQAAVAAETSFKQCFEAWRNYGRRGEFNPNHTGTQPTDDCTAKLTAFETAVSAFATCRITPPSSPVVPTPTPVAK